MPKFVTLDLENAIVLIIFNQEFYWILIKLIHYLNEPVHDLLKSRVFLILYILMYPTRIWA